MQVLFVLFASCLIFRAIGLAGFDMFGTWMVSARWALATMFLFTATSHFGPMRKDLIAMVPPALPRPDLLVSFTGVAEAIGAVGLLAPGTRYGAAWGLIALLVLLLPANISAARRGVLLRGKVATALWIRIPMQASFIVWTWAVR